MGGAGGGAWGWKPGGGVPLTLFSLVDVFIGARRDQRCGLDVDEVDFLIFGDCGNFFGVFFLLFYDRLRKQKKKRNKTNSVNMKKSNKK